MTKFGDLLDGDIPIVICFYADWHAFSMKMMPVLKEVAIVMGNNAKVLKLDVDKNRELAKALQIGNLPILLIYKNKREVCSYVGFTEAYEIVSELNKEYLLNKKYV